MADALKSFKEMEIDKYISNVLVEEYIDVNKIKKDLKEILHEEPGVNLEYAQETMLNEDGSEEIKVERLNSISIYYTYEKGVDDKGNTIFGFDKQVYNLV